jgi:hypothetical protein
VLLLSDIRQPTTRRVKGPPTTARQRKPDQVGMYVSRFEGTPERGPASLRPAFPEGCRSSLRPREAPARAASTKLQGGQRKPS